MTFEKESKSDLIKHKLEKANSSVNDVRFLIDNDKLVIAVNRISRTVVSGYEGLYQQNQRHDSIRR